MTWHAISESRPLVGSSRKIIAGSLTSCTAERECQSKPCKALGYAQDTEQLAIVANSAEHLQWVHAALCSALIIKRVGGCRLGRRSAVVRTDLQADADPAPLAAADALDAQRLVADQRVLAAAQLLQRHSSWM